MRRFPVEYGFLGEKRGKNLQKFTKIGEFFTLFDKNLQKPTGFSQFFAFFCTLYYKICL